VAETQFSNLLQSQTNEVDRARLLAVSAPHSSDWLLALPISNCGLRLDDEAIRVAVGLRLGADICSSHRCICGALVDSSGVHSLSCKKSSARISRHAAINDVVHRGFIRASIPAVKEPAGLLRSDGKRPDGATQIPWQSGKCMSWDVTVTDTLAPSYVARSATSASSAAERAASNKVIKYTQILASHDFTPLAIETLGPINASGLTLLSQLCRRISAVSGDTRKTSFLLQRISVTLQRFNSLALSCTFDSLHATTDEDR